MTIPLRRLGKSDLMVTPIGLGCWQFSQNRGWNKYWPTLPEDEIEAIVAASLDGGINWFDTAEAYGSGESERQLSRVLQKAGRRAGDVIVATKWMPFLRRAGNIGRTIDRRIDCLAPFPIDLYQIHTPDSISSTEKTASAMAALVKAKKIRCVGVSNYGEKLMRRTHHVLAEEGVPLVSNQVHYSLLHRLIERNGILNAAKELGISIIAYSPLEQGVLTGRFHDDPAALKAVHGLRRVRSFYRGRALRQSRDLIEALKQVAERHAATPAQVALNWLYSFHGESVVVIPGASKRIQAESNVKAMTFSLGPADLDCLDEISRPLLDR
jgi:aryl-alcohol dehydrogenase-like predicted oxidoreductase